MRRRRPEKRTILPDTKYDDLSVAKFINYIMESGKKGVAEKIFYGAMDIIQNKTKTDGLKIFKKGIENTLRAFQELKAEGRCPPMSI